MQRDHLHVRDALAIVEFASPKRLLGLGRREVALHPEQGRELLQKLAASFADSLRQLGIVIGKVEEGSRCAELLALEQHRRVWPEEEQCGQRAKPAGTRQLLQPLAASRVRDLVMILCEADELAGR